MKHKFLKLITSSWFALQALFTFYWPIYLYYQTGFKFYEMLLLGCIILPTSVFFMIKNKIINKIMTCLLWIYSIAFAVIGTLANLVASPKPTLALALTIIMVINIALLIENHFHFIIRESTPKKKDDKLKNKGSHNINHTMDNMFLPDSTPYLPASTFIAIRYNNPKGIYIRKK